MAESLKKGIGTKYLLPIVTFYAAAAGLVGFDRSEVIRSLVEHAGVAGISGIALLVLQDIVPRSWKEAIVFWRLRDRVPGCRAFSVVAKSDQRVNQAELSKLLPATSMSPGEENALWYRWLKEADKDPGICDNHHRFLALRDSAVLVLLLTLVSPFLLLLGSRSMAGTLWLTAATAGAYLLTALAAAQAAKRLVGNVIAWKLAHAPGKKSRSGTPRKK